MKLALRLVLAFTVVIFAILLVDSLVVMHGRATLFEEGVQLDMRRFGRLLRDSLIELRAAKGDAAVAELATRFRSEHLKVSFRLIPRTALASSKGAQLDSENLRQLSQGEDVVRVVSTPGAADQLAFYSTFDGQVLEIKQSLSAMHRYVRGIWVRGLVVAGAMLIAGFGVSLLLGIRTVGAPLRQVIEKTRRVGRGDLGDPLLLRRHDELREVAEALNEMCDRLRDAREQLRQEAEARVAAVEQLRHADRLHTVGQLASGIAHEIGTPLNVISGRAAMLASPGLTSEEIREMSGIIRRQADRITKIVRGLLDFSRRGVPRAQESNVCEAIREAAELLEPMARKSGVEIRIPAAAEARASIDVGQIQQVFTNLINNAIQAMPGGDAVTVTIEPVSGAPPDVPNAPSRPYWRISVSDTGCGIRPEHLPNLFEPFFTTKDVGEGTGLGLSIAYGIVKEHGGWIDVQSEVGAGSCFSVYLPREHE